MNKPPLRYLCRLSLLWLAVWLTSGCERRRPWHEEAGYRWRPLRQVEAGRAGFTLMPENKTGVR